jgi:hypothetical protein
MDFGVRAVDVCRIMCYAGRVKRFGSIALFITLLTAAHAQPQAPPIAIAAEPAISAERLHPAYKLPARCFAYVGNESDAKTWKLPYRLADGAPDVKRLPAAIQAVLTGYRGKKVSGIPEQRVPDVLSNLGRAAAQAGKMPFQDPKAAAVYRQLQTALEESGRLEEIKAARQEK